MSPPRGRLFRRLLLPTLLPTTAVLLVFGLLAHEWARRALEDELGKRLATAAAGVAGLILPEQVTALAPGDEGSLTYRLVRRRLDEAKERLGVRRVLLVARDLTGRSDTEGLVALGALAHELGADQPELERTARGNPTASPLFIGRDGRPYKRGYARIGEQPAGFVVVEGSAEYFASLSSFRRRLVSGGVVGLALVTLLSALVTRRITGPLVRLAGAAERIGRGDLGAPVAVETTDELGFLARRLDEMRAALQARDERLQMMLAGIAHEVRNPLGGLELYAGLLREGLEGQPERLAEVGRIEREIGHLKTVVSEFLEYARRPPLSIETVPVRPLLLEVVEVAGQGEADVQVDAAAELTVQGDRGQLRRALVNLVRNAVVAAGARGRVVVGARATSGARVAVQVSDSGPGVPDELREKIFTPFFTTREKGTGLGLAFVREILRDHGTDVQVDRAPEGGARFTFELPVSR